MKVRFKNTATTAVFCKYGNGNNAIQLVDYRGPYAHASVNPPDQQLADDEVAIKDWSENEGMAQALISAGVVAYPAVGYVNSGFVVIGIYKLTPAAQQEIAS